MKLLPESVANASDAARLIKVFPGTAVYLKHDVGDFNGIKSVTIPKGHPGRLAEFTISSEGLWKANVSILPSPGQTSITCLLEDFSIFWTTEKPEDADPSGRLAAILEDRGSKLLDG